MTEETRATIHAPRYGSMFVDSGAYTLYNEQVLKRGKGKLLGKHGKELDHQPVRWGSGDYSYYSLKPGSPFRAYCDEYAKMIKEFDGTGVIFTTVDAIHNPHITWEVQLYFEKEHGISPVPVIHFGTPLKFIERYVEDGTRTLLGIGGLGHGIGISRYMRWGDGVFRYLCPASNGHLPVVRTHGFAMTSWKLMRRWPWWSVDSASWVKYSAYGWVCIPKLVRGEWDPLRDPEVINFSDKSPLRKKRGDHIDTIPRTLRRHALEWLEECGIPEEGVRTHHSWRNTANLLFFKLFEESLPEWPPKLDTRIVLRDSVRYGKGFGL